MAPFEPSDREDEYFLKMDAEKIKKMRAELDKKRESEAQKQRKDAHWMKCPKCGSDLKEISYQNVMIDTCTECKGIWLDHGELELLAKGQAKMTKGFLSRLLG
jgi:acetyl-CoA carboxylase beta subunit